MCIRLLLLATLLLATGCTHQQPLRLDEVGRLARFNAQATEQIAVVTLSDGETHSARSLQVTPDLTSWIDPGSNAVMSVPTHDVADVRLRDRGKGALDGLGLGVVIGGLTGAVIGLASGDDDPDLLFAFKASEKAMVGGIGLGLLGGIVGLVVGGVAGSEEVYQIDRGPQSGTAQNERDR